MDNNSQTTTTDEINKKKTLSSYLKWLGGIIGAIFLGALGSGLWEKFLSPALLWLFEKVSSLSRHISSSFMDSVYQEISNGFHEFYSVQTYTFIFIIIATGYVALLFLYIKIQKKKKEQPKTKQTSPKKLKMYKITFWVCFIVGIVLSTLNISEATYVNITTTKTLSNIEIISAVIEDKEYKMLKSEFHSMMSENDFLKLQEKIAEIAEKNNLRLKK